MMQRRKLLKWLVRTKRRLLIRLWRRDQWLLDTTTHPCRAWRKITVVRRKISVVRRKITVVPSRISPKNTDWTSLQLMINSTTNKLLELRSSTSKTVWKRETSKSTETLMSSWKCIWNSNSLRICTMLCNGRESSRSWLISSRCPKNWMWMARIIRMQVWTILGPMTSNATKLVSKLSLAISRLHSSIYSIREMWETSKSSSRSSRPKVMWLQSKSQRRWPDKPTKSKKCVLKVWEMKSKIGLILHRPKSPWEHGSSSTRNMIKLITGNEHVK